MEPLTAALTFGYWPGTHRVDAGWFQNDPVPGWRQFNLESLEENKNSRSCVAALRKSFVTALSMSAARAGTTFRFRISLGRMDRARMQMVHGSVGNCRGQRDAENQP
jgi:hypothetical protein